MRLYYICSSGSIKSYASGAYFIRREALTFEQSGDGVGKTRLWRHLNSGFVWRSERALNASRSCCFECFGGIVFCAVFFVKE